MKTIVGKILVCIVLILLFVGSPESNADKAFDEVNSGITSTGMDSLYETPEDTIRTYYESNDPDYVSNCFYTGGFSGTREKFWSDFEIVTKEKSEKTGEKSYLGLTISGDAVEITVEVTMVKTQKKTRFWFLLQPVKDQWKIIEHSHISDTNYPSYD